MASLRNCIFGDFSDVDGLNAKADVAVVKKKLCRVSNGYKDSQSLLRFNGLNGDNDCSNEMGSELTTEGVAREIGRDHLVEISVVKGSSFQQPSKQHSFECQTYLSQDTLEQRRSEQEVEVPMIENANDIRFVNEINKSSAAKRRKRVAFVDAVTVHNFENEEDNYADENSENMFDMDDDELPLSEIPEGPTESIQQRNPIANSESQTTVSKKVPLRRLVFGQVTRAYNKAHLFRSFLRDSFRKPASSFQRSKTVLGRSKSLADRSVRHSFIKAEDPTGTYVHLVVPIGPHHTPNDVVVTTSGDGRKIKVLAVGKGSKSNDDPKHDYHECFYLPKAINPLLTKATVDSEGILKIEAPFATEIPSLRMSLTWS